VLYAGGFHFCRHFVHTAGAGAVCSTTLHIHRVVHRVAEVSILIGHVVQVVFHVQRFLRARNERAFNVCANYRNHLGISDLLSILIS